MNSKKREKSNKTNIFSQQYRPVKKRCEILHIFEIFINRSFGKEALKGKGASRKPGKFDMSKVNQMHIVLSHTSIILNNTLEKRKAIIKSYLAQICNLTQKNIYECGYQGVESPYSWEWAGQGVALL